MDFNRMSDEEKKVLEEVAKAKGQTLDEALEELGHAVQREDETVSIEEPKVVVEEPVPVPVDPPDDDLTVKVEEPPAFEPPPAEEEEIQAVEEEPVEQDLEQGFATVNNVCIQCGWDQSNPVIGEPDKHEKLAFLQCLLGQKVFSKNYKLFGGQLKIGFRTLSIKEIDALYASTFTAQKAGVIATTADYYQYLNRLRLYLQITSLSSQVGALHIRLPDGFTEETHPGAKSCWDTYLKDKGVYIEDKPLVDQVADYVVLEVLKSEHLQRVVTNQCNKFNRLVAKLEACVDNQDFWKETEQLS